MGARRRYYEHKKGTLAFAKNKPEALASWLQVNQQIH